MSGIALQASAGGSAAVTIAAPETNTPLAYQLPKVSGQVIVPKTFTVTATGTSIDLLFPEGATKVILGMRRVSSTGTAIMLAQVYDSSGLLESGYSGGISSSGGTINNTTGGFGIANAVAAADVYDGTFTIISGDGFCIHGGTGQNQVPGGRYAAGSVPILGSLIFGLRLSANGNSFDGGTFIVRFE